jgi:CrcB protein
MKEILYVALGGALGAMGRFAVSSALSPLSSIATIPLAIVGVNVLGCFFAGLLLGASEQFAWFTGDLRVFLFTGVLGGFTTFSAFGIEALTLFRAGHTVALVSYVGLSLIGSLAAVWCGYALAQSP